MSSLLSRPASRLSGLCAWVSVSCPWAPFWLCRLALSVQVRLQVWGLVPRPAPWENTQ